MDTTSLIGLVKEFSLHVWGIEQTFPPSFHLPRKIIPMTSWRKRTRNEVVRNGWIYVVEMGVLSNGPHGECEGPVTGTHKAHLEVYPLFAIFKVNTS